MITAPGRPHPWQQHPGTLHRCQCGRTRAYRIHQPLWWRILHPAARWR